MEALHGYRLYFVCIEHAISITDFVTQKFIKYTDGIQ